jgi:hypothetical protein
MNAHAATVTVAITSSAVITAGAAMSGTTLAAGEQVHIAARANRDGTYTAVRVMLQAPEHEADETPEADAGD